jgi:phosphatidylglycerol:prolipoprotein diacylglycerol transferase
VNPISWQHLPERMSPIIFEIGSFQIRYYSLMYIIAFLLTYILVSYRIKREDYRYSAEIIQDFFVWAVTGLIVGARFGYVLFYNFAHYVKYPLEIILPFDFAHGMQYVGISGMSYHGGAIGVLISSVIFCRKHKIDFWRFADLFCPAIPLGYTFGRIGNFINGELYGRITAMPWGMYFPLDFTHQLRHPSQLYEALFEGVFLFIVLWSIRKKSPFDGFIFALYLFGYGLVRFIIEFFREPDSQLGLFGGIVSMGQMLCILMMLAGGCVYFFGWKRKTGAPLRPA